MEITSPTLNELSDQKADTTCGNKNNTHIQYHRSTAEKVDGVLDQETSAEPEQGKLGGNG
jgi:hypothetical protein